MTRGILLVANESSLADAVADAAKARVKEIVKAISPNRFAPTGVGQSVSPVQAQTDAPGQQRKPKGSADGTLPWNPASPVAARSLVVAAGNRLGRVDEAVLVCSPMPMRRRPDELVPAEIDVLVDDLVKGWFLVARELALSFRARNGGTMAFVLSEAGLGGAKDEIPDLFGIAAAAAFRAFASAMLATSFREGYGVLAFSSAEAGDDAGFAEFVFKTLDAGNKKDSGKWHKYGKSGIFGLLQ